MGFCARLEPDHRVRINEYSDFGTTVNPRVGLVWNTAYRLTTKLLYGRAFRPRSFAERHSNGLFLGLGDPDLEPITIDMVELAFNYRAARWPPPLMNPSHWAMPGSARAR